MILSEQREVHAAIAAVLHKVWMAGEVVVFAVFKDKQSVGFQ
jgi:hypothetical protein